MRRYNHSIAVAVAALLVTAATAIGNDLEGKIVTEIHVTGLSYTKRYIVDRELTSKVGEPYSRAKTDEDEIHLDRLRIFSSIDISASEVDDGVRIDIRVRETFPYMPTISIQVNDENGVSAGPGFKSPNFLGRAIEVGAALQFGGATNIDAYITNPWVTGNHVSFEARYLHRDRPNELDKFHEISNEIHGRVGRFIGESGRVGALASFSTVRSDRDGVTISPDNEDEIPGVGFYLGYDTRDIWSRPHNGWRNEIDVIRYEVLDAETGFFKTDIDIRRYHTWRERHTIMLTSLTTLQTGVVGENIPTYADYHIGGTNTIRGWPLDSRSGKNQFINTVEYRYMMAEPRPFSLSFFTAYVGLQIAAFTDFGAAWDEPNEFAANEFISGYGIGLRLLIPFVDEIRLDVAWGAPGEGIRFHFGLYPKVVMQRQRVR